MADSGMVDVDTSAIGSRTPDASVPAPVATVVADPQTAPKSTRLRDEPLSAPVKADTAAVIPPPDAKPPQDWEKRYKDVQSAFTKSQQDAVEMRERLARIEGAQSVQQTTQQAPPQPKPFYEDESWMAQYKAIEDEDPVQAARMMATAQEQRLAQMTLGRDEYLMAQMEKKLEARTNPERLKLQDSLSELVGHKWFQALDDNAQLEAARDWQASKGTEKPVSDTVVAPVTSIGGTGMAAPPRDTADALARKTAELSARMGPLPGTTQDSVNPTFTNNR